MIAMRTVVTVSLTALLVVGGVVPVVGALGAVVERPGGSVATDAGPSHAARTTGANATAGASESTAPAGSQLAGAFSAQQSDVNGELAIRRIGIRLARADTVDERARILADLREATDERLQAMEQRRERLRAARATDSLSPGAIAHVTASLSVETTVTQRLTARGEREAETIPAAVAERHGVSADVFASLHNRSQTARTDLESIVGDRLAADGPVSPPASGDQHDGGVPDTVRNGTLGETLNRTVEPDGPDPGANSDLVSNSTTGGRDERSLAGGANGSDGLLGGTGLAGENATNGSDGSLDGTTLGG